jgi:hypothetical protein
MVGMAEFCAKTLYFGVKIAAMGAILNFFAKLLTFDCPYIIFMNTVNYRKEFSGR